MTPGRTHSKTPISFPVKHVGSHQVFQREDIFINAPSNNQVPASALIDPNLVAFHSRFPHYGTTPLIELPDVARELGVGHVFLKDESFRFGLPSFKILGASWAVYRAVCKETGLPPSVTLEEAGKAAQNAGLDLVTCTDGNWGRAVSRTAKYMGIKTTIYVPKTMDEATRVKLRSEGATVNVVNGNYDDSIAAAMKDSEHSGGLLVMDTSWDGFEKICQWVVEGYATMHGEVDRQVKDACGRLPSICVASVGVGSWAQSVAVHYKSINASTQMVTVESVAASCLMESLRNGRIIPVDTGHTICDGMNCGTVSTIAWPVLKSSVDFSVAITDVESHECVNYLADQNVNAGPCGAAPLAAIRKLYKRGVLLEDPNAVIVLFSTEGNRDYVVPTDEV